MDEKKINRIVMNISTCLAVIDNLKLTKNTYEFFRKIYPKEELCISANGTSDTKDWLSSLNDDNLKWKYSSEKLNLSENYNIAVSLATKDKIVLYHNDMVPALNFLEVLDKNQNENFVLGYTTVEPPIFSGHTRPGKIIKDFGTDFDNLKYEEFLNFSKSVPENIQPGVCFFMSCFKTKYESIGGFDGKVFRPAFSEDDDFILRLLHSGAELMTTSLSMVYHFISKTSRFGTTVYDNWKMTSTAIESNSVRNFIRKWGNKYEGSKNQKVPVFDIGYELKNCDGNIIFNLEPFARNILLENNEFSVDDFISKNQENSSFDLRKKFVDKLDNDVIVEIDCKKLKDENFLYLIHLPFALLEFKNEIGKFEYGDFIINIQRIAKDGVDRLVKNSDFYESRKDLRFIF